MKKVIAIFSLFVVILLSGCSKEKSFTCEIDIENKIQEYHLNAIYKVYYKDSYVTKIEKKEIYETNNEDTYNYFNEYKNLEYKNINNLYGGTTYNINLEESKVILDATIDMTLVDIKKMIKDGYVDRDYIISNKLTVGGVKNIYKEKGAICDI